MSFKIFNNVADGDQLLNVFVCDLDTEILLAHENQVSDLQGVDSQIVLKLCLGSDCRLVYMKILHKNFFDFF